MTKLTPSQYSAFSKSYRTETSYAGQRYGQAFYNKFLSPEDFENSLDDRKFFYTDDSAWVNAYIWGHFIECEVPEPHSQED